MIRWGAHFGFLTVAALILAGCASTRQSRDFETQFGLAKAALAQDIKTLASDEFLGRRPGTEGESKTLDFMQRELSSAGLVSGSNDPSNPWRAPVRLVRTAAQSGSITIKLGTTEIALSNQDAAVLTEGKRALVEGAKLVYVGKAEAGASAAAVAGHVAILEGEPGKSPARRAKLFEQGAISVITLLESSLAINSLRSTAGRERFQLASAVDPAISAFVTRNAMRKVFVGWADKVEGLDELQQSDPSASLPIDATVRIEANSERREVISHNLIAKLPGTDPNAGSVLMLAHWDHFGECGELGDVDRLCNGAADNASGVALMIELARRLAQSGPHDRDIYVLGTTAEEWGLLGVEAFAEDPPIPLTEIVAAFNFDTVALAPRGGPVGFIGEGKTVLDPLILEAIAESGREQGSRVLAEQFLQRQDGWALLQRGVPTVIISSAFGEEETLNAYLRTRYHSADDEFEALELGGAVEDLLLHEALIERVASTASFPNTPQ